VIQIKWPNRSRWKQEEGDIMAHCEREACYKARLPHEQRNQPNIKIYPKKVVARHKCTMPSVEQRNRDFTCLSCAQVLLGPYTALTRHFSKQHGF
jgi:hypothetical protein